VDAHNEGKAALTIPSRGRLWLREYEELSRSEQDSTIGQSRIGLVELSSIAI
jgi:hypothetical protein